MFWRVITAKVEEENDQDGELAIDLHSFGPFDSEDACIAFVKEQKELREKAINEDDSNVEYEIEDGATVATMSPTGLLTRVRDSDLT